MDDLTLQPDAVALFYRDGVLTLPGSPTSRELAVLSRYGAQVTLRIDSADLGSGQVAPGVVGSDAHADDELAAVDFVAKLDMLRRDGWTEAEWTGALDDPTALRPQTPDPWDTPDPLRPGAPVPF